MLKRGDLTHHLLEFIRVLEAVTATIGRIETLQGEVAASLARCLSIALDLPSLALIARD